MYIAGKCWQCFRKFRPLPIPFGTDHWNMATKLMDMAFPGSKLTTLRDLIQLTQRAHHPSLHDDATDRADADCCGQLLLLLCVSGYAVVQQVCSSRLPLGVLLSPWTQDSRRNFERWISLDQCWPKTKLVVSRC